MKKAYLAMVAIGLLICQLSGVSNASTVFDTFTSSYYSTSGWKVAAQVITAPDESKLINYSFGIAAQPSPGTINFSIYEWDFSDGAIGTALFSRDVDWGTNTRVDITDINLNLQTGTTYGMVVDLLENVGPYAHLGALYAEDSFYYAPNAYSDGYACWGHSADDWDIIHSMSDDFLFRAEFETSSVPIPGAILLLGSGLLSLARICRKKEY